MRRWPRSLLNNITQTASVAGADPQLRVLLLTQLNTFLGFRNIIKITFGDQRGSMKNSSSNALLSSMDSLLSFVNYAMCPTTTAANSGTSNAVITNNSTFYYNTPQVSTGTYWYPTYNDNFLYLIKDWDYNKCVTDSDYPSTPVCDHTILADGTNVLEFAVTKFKREELKIKIDDNKLIITGKREADGNVDKDSICIHSKIAKRYFSVSFTVPEKLDITKTTSDLKDGVLTIKIPMSEEMQRRNKSIEIG